MAAWHRGSFLPPLHPDLNDEYDNGGWCVRNGYVVVNDLRALKDGENYQQ